MFGLVAAMGVAAANSSQAATAAVTAPVRADSGAIVSNTPTATAPGTIAPTTVAPGAAEAPAPSAPTGPIVLQARPQVSVVDPAPAAAAPAPAPAPAAVTSGSA